MSENNDQIEWYIARDGHQHGPLSQDELDKFIEFGHLKPTDLLWRAGFPEWRLASDVFQGPPPDVAEELPPPAPGPTASANPAGANDADARGGERSGAGDTAGPAQTHQASRAGTSQPAASPTPAGIASASAGQGEPRHPQSFADAWQQAEQRAAHETAQPSPGPAQGQDRAARTDASFADDPRAHQDGGAAGASRSRPDAYDEDDYEYEEEGGQSGWLAIAATILILGLIGAGGWFAYNNQDEIAALYSDVMSAAKTDRDDITIVRAPEAATRSAASGNDGASQTGSLAAQRSEQLPTTASLSPPKAIADSDGALANVPLLKSEVWAFAEREFPTWTGKQLDAAREMVAAEKSAEAINGHLVNAFVAFRRDNAALALLASPSRLEAVAIAFVESLKALTARGNEGCYAFISSGEGTDRLAPVYFEPAIEEKIDAQMLAIMSAIVEAKSKPIARSPPKAEDFEMLSGDLNQRGWSDGDLKLFSNPDALSRAKPEVVCRLVTEWFSAQTTLADRQARDRLIAASLRPVIGG